jgi:hypothetical protein
MPDHHLRRPIANWSVDCSSAAACSITYLQHNLEDVAIVLILVGIEFDDVWMSELRLDEAGESDPTLFQPSQRVFHQGCLMRCRCLHFFVRFLSHFRDHLAEVDFLHRKDLKHLRVRVCYTTPTFKVQCSPFRLCVAGLERRYQSCQILASSG